MSDLHPKFYNRPVPDPVKSDEEGRPVFKSIPYVKIRIPGDNKNVVDRKVAEEDKLRWPQHWQAFQQGAKEVVEGTPVDQWPILQVDQIATLKANGFMTIESIAGCNDSNIKSLGTKGFAMKQRAQAYIDAAKGGAGTDKLAKENAELREKLEEQNEKIALQGVQIDKLMQKVDILSQGGTTDDDDDEEGEDDGEGEETDQAKIDAEIAAAVNAGGAPPIAPTPAAKPKGNGKKKKKAKKKG